MSDDPIQCTKCQSQQIHAGRRGWSLIFGVFGMNSVVLTCLKCGNKFKPGGAEFNDHWLWVFGITLTIVIGICLAQLSTQVP